MISRSSKFPNVSEKRMKAIACATAALFAVLALPAAQAQEAAGDADAVAIAGPDLNQFVSPNLEAEEQTIMQSTLNRLPRQVRERMASHPSGSVHIAIVEGGTGIIHYNRPEDVGSYEAQPDDSALPGDDNPLLQNAVGEPEKARPDGVRDPGTFGGSGPYRRVYTTPVTAAPQPKPTGLDIWAENDYWQGGFTTLHCKAGYILYGDTGYSYMGGWGGSGSLDAPGNAVDAGLQYSAINDNYAMFMKVAGLPKILTKGTSGTAVTPPRMQCTDGLDGAEVKFSPFGEPQLYSVDKSCWKGSPHDHNLQFIGFPVEKCNTYALALEVSSDRFVGHDDVQTYYLVWFSPDINLGGWGQLTPYTAKYFDGKKNVKGWIPKAPCGDCIFKWMTSIAQTSQNLTDQSTYEQTWSSRQISNWPASEKLVGITTSNTSCSEYPLWHSRYPSDHGEDCMNTPAQLTGLEKTVGVKNYSTGGESDTISLTY